MKIVSTICDRCEEAEATVFDIQIQIGQQPRQVAGETEEDMGIFHVADFCSDCARKYLHDFFRKNTNKENARIVECWKKWELSAPSWKMKGG